MNYHFSLSLLFVCVACNNFEGKSKETFSTKFSCPKDRITSKARPDLRAYDLIFGPQTKEEPPAEVKSDPGRLAVWEEKQQQTLKSQDSWNSSSAIFEVSGCEQEAIYVCMTDNDGYSYCQNARAGYQTTKESPLPVAPKTLPR